MSAAASVPAGTRLRYQPLAATFTLWRPFDDVDPDAVFQQALEPFEALADVVEPLAFDLWLAGRPATEPYLSRAARVEKPMWHLGVEHPPADVRPAPPSGRPFEIGTAPSLSSEHLRAWFARALRQPAPSAEMVLTLDTLICEDQRALLLSEPPPASCEVKLHNLVLTRPCEPAANGAWVAFPLPDLEVSPPVRVKVTNEGDILVADIWVSWAPWSQPGSPESAAVEAGLARMTGRGWLLRDVRDEAATVLRHEDLADELPAQPPGRTIAVPDQLSGVRVVGEEVGAADHPRGGAPEPERPGTRPPRRTGQGSSS